MVELFLKYDCEVNVCSDDGTTALMLAVREGAVKSVEMLLEKGADFLAEDKNKNTAHLIAEENERFCKQNSIYERSCQEYSRPSLDQCEKILRILNDFKYYGKRPSHSPPKLINLSGSSKNIYEK